VLSDISVTIWIGYGILKKCAQILFVICLACLYHRKCCLGSEQRWLYTSGFEKYDVQQRMAQNGLLLTQNDLDNIARDFIHYFNSSEEFIHLTVQIGWTSH